MTKEQKLFEQLDAFSRKYSELIKNTNEETGSIKYRFVVLSLPADFPNTPLSDELLITLVQKNKELYEIEKSIRTIFFTPFADDPEMMTKWKADHGDAEPPEIYIPKPEFFADPESLLSFVLNSIYRPYRSPEETEIINAARFLSGFLYAFTDLLAGTVRSEEVQREQLELIQNSWDKLIEYIDADLQDIEKLYKDTPEGLQEKELIPFVNRTSDLYYPHNKLSRNLEKLTDNTSLELKVSAKGATIIYTEVTGTRVNYKISGKDKSFETLFDSYDQVVLRAFCSLYKEARERKPNSEKQFIPFMLVYQFITNTTTDEASPEIKARIYKSVDKLRNTGLKIDCRDESELYAHLGEKYESVALHVFPAEWYVDYNSEKVKGNKVPGWYMFEQSPYLNYAIATGQLYTIPKAHRPKAKRNSNRVILIGDYLIQAIGYIKNGGTNVIKYDSIYELIAKEEGFNPKDKTPKVKRIKQQIRDNTKELLNDLKTKPPEAITSISSYKENSTGQTAVSLTIYYKRSNKGLIKD